MKTTSYIGDQELLAKLQAADNQGFSILFKEYYSRLCLFAKQLVGAEQAKDVVEDTYIKFWEKRPQFESKQHLKAHLYHSVKNACLDFLKTSANAAQRQREFVDLNADTEESYLNAVIRSEVVGSLYLAIQSLPPQCAKIITLTYIDGYSNQEVADQLNLSLQTIKNQKLRGLSLLRNRFPNDGYLLLLIYPYLHLFDHLSKN